MKRPGVALTIHPYLDPLWKGGAIPHLPLSLYGVFWVKLAFQNVILKLVRVVKWRSYNFYPANEVVYILFITLRVSNEQQIFIHSIFCLTTGSKPPPKRFLHIVRSRASSFKWEYPLLSLRSSFSILSNDRSKASSKTIPPHSAV